MTWQRLEGVGVPTDSLEEGLSARIADPLWLLARQWQVGEFSGEDAASPVAVHLTAGFHLLGELRRGDGGPEPLAPGGAPLEPRVEAETPLDGAARARLSAEAALQLLRMAGSADDVAVRLRAAHPLALPPDDGLDPRGRLALELLAARAFDGEALAASLRAGAAPDPAIAGVATAWLAGLDARFEEPEAGGDAWSAEHMEYAFAVAAPTFDGGTRLDADSHPGGDLDWHAFDIAGGTSGTLAAGATERTLETLPVPLRYAGMPAARWWAFEDGAVSWGDVQGGPEDLPRHLVAAFATLYGDDYHLVSLDLPYGALAQVTTVEVVDSFGRHTTVPAAAAADAAQDARRPWRLFELSGDPGPAAGAAPLLLVAPAVPPHEQGPPLEEVLLVRDEGANLAWAVERVVVAASGRRASRAREALPEAPAPARGAWGYRLQTPVPPSYIPLVPVRTRPPRPAIRLQRGRMAGTRAGALGLVLEPWRRLLIHEEEVPAGGARVTRAFEWCRSPDGSAHLWIGRRKRPGRGPAASGLAHDVLTVPAEEQPA